MLTALELHWIPQAQTGSVAILMLAFVVPLEILAGIFALTGVFQASGGPPMEAVAGWIGLPLAAFSLYGGLALLLEDSAQRTILPLGRRGRARASLEADLSQQILNAEWEAGVRRQL